MVSASQTLISLLFILIAIKTLGDLETGRAGGAEILTFRRETPATSVSCLKRRLKMTHSGNNIELNKETIPFNIKILKIIKGVWWV